MERGIIDQAEFVDFRVARKICEDHGADIEAFLETQAEMDNIDTTELFTWLGYQVLFSHLKEGNEIMSDYEKAIIKEFTDAALNEGFEVWLAKCETHGFYTDETGQRVVSFQCGLGSQVEFSGNYVASRESGTGWQIGPMAEYTSENMMKYLNANAPHWTRNKNPKYTTRNQHLERYGKSSGYTKLNKAREND